jgi:hypothetical protein
MHHVYQVSQRRSNISEEESAMELQDLSGSLVSPYETDHDSVASDDEGKSEALILGRTGAQWTPGFWARLPILGLLSLLGSLVGKSEPTICYRILSVH